MFLLAPLERHSDAAFRMLCRKYGADRSYVEMINILSRKFDPALLNGVDKNTGIQVMATRVPQVKKFIDVLKDRSIVCRDLNLNMGCPDNNIVSAGGGCALMKRLKRAQELVDALRRYDVPVTLKFRLGLNAYEKKHKVYLHVLRDVEADSYTIHAKHAREHSYDSPDWSVYDECVETGKEIIANGGIQTREHVRKLSSQGIKSFMIGRPAMRNPSIFQFFKGDQRVGKKELLEQYNVLQKKFPSQEVYKKQFHHWLFSELK